MRREKLVCRRVLYYLRQQEFYQRTRGSGLALASGNAVRTNIVDRISALWLFDGGAPPEY